MNYPIYVAIPIYNGARTIRKTLNNLFEQTFEDFTAVIYNDGSTDETAQILYQYEKRDSRIRVLHGVHNLGRGAARNRLLEAARDGLIAWQDDDDTWAPTKLAQQLAFFEALPGLGVDPSRAVLISTFCKTLTKRDQMQLTTHVPPEVYDAAYVFGDDYPKCPFQLQCTLGLASAYEACGGFDEALNWSEDIDMALRLLSNGYRIIPHRCDEPLTTYHQSLVGVKGEVVAQAQQVLMDRYRDFARRNGVDIDELFSKRRLNYLFSVYLANNNFPRAIATSLASIIEADDEKLMLVSRNIVATFRAILAAEQAKAGAPRGET